MLGYIIIALIILGLLLLLRSNKNKERLIEEKLVEQFPKPWLEILKDRIVFYEELNEVDKRMFEKRVQLFLATKSIEGIDTEIDDNIRLMVAASAVIPTFAFPDYNYPHVQTILIYPNSFDENFQTERYKGHKEAITGMVEGRYQSSTVIFSKPELTRSFDGIEHKENVGIHEFVHLLDKEDGEVDGIPEVLIQHSFVGPWLLAIRKEIKKIENRNSDINPYALKSNAEFLAVVSEYFFSNPDKFKRKHPELYQFLSTAFKSE